MLKLKKVRRKNPYGFCKWECKTVQGEYVVIRYKENSLDVRIAKSLSEFLLGKSRCIYRQELKQHKPNYIDFEKVVDMLGLEVDISV